MQFLKLEKDLLQGFGSRAEEKTNPYMEQWNVEINCASGKAGQVIDQHPLFSRLGHALDLGQGTAD